MIKKKVVLWIFVFISLYKHIFLNYKTGSNVFIFSFKDLKVIQILLNDFNFMNIFLLLYLTIL